MRRRAERRARGAARARARAASPPPPNRTRQYAKSVRYAGHSERFAAPGGTVIIHGKADPAAPAAAKFVAYYVEAGAVAAVATYDYDPFAAAALELFRLGKLPPPALLAEPRFAAAPFDLVAHLRDVAPKGARRASVAL